MPIYHGAWPALITPHAGNGVVNVAVLRDLATYLVGKNIGGLYVCGSTGEGIYMSVAERKHTLEVVMEQVGDQTAIIAHVGAMAAADAADLAAHAQSVGAHGVASIIPPQYGSLDSIVAYYRAIGAAAPDLPLLAYVLNPTIPVLPFMQALQEIPTLAGAKYTGPNMFEFRQVLEMGTGNWSVFSGMDEQCLFASMLGSCGNIGSTLNYHPGGYARIHDLVKAGEHEQALDLQLRLNRVTEIAMGYGYMGALYAMMERLGFACGDPRLPNKTLSAQAKAELNQQLDGAGFDELAAM